MEHENNDLTVFLSEISSIVTKDSIDEDEAMGLIEAKLAAYLAQHPDEGLRISKTMQSDFMRRRIEQLLQETSE